MVRLEGRNLGEKVGVEGVVEIVVEEVRVVEVMDRG